VAPDLILSSTTTSLLKERAMPPLCWLSNAIIIAVFYHTTTVLGPFFWNHPGEPVPEENFWTSGLYGARED